MHPIWIVWKDERYTIPENLLADAKKKLKEQAYPVLSFEVTVNDLAETDDRYSFLKMGLYDIAHVIIDEHTEIIEKVIKLQRHHDSPEKNKITLSSEPQTITGKVNDAISILGNDGEKLKGSVLQQAQEMATKLINAWAEKGYIYQTQNEIYILDALPKENAKYCIRMNLGGIAFSQNGWQGPYNSAWTIDGKFNADFITAGTLRGIRITNGNNFNVDADGNVSANGLKATNAEITGKISGSTITGTLFDGGTIRTNDGDIGGWSINSNGLYNGTVKIKNSGITNIYTWADLYIIRLIIMGTVDADDDMVYHYDFNGDGKITPADYATLKNRLKAM